MRDQKRWFCSRAIVRERLVYFVVLCQAKVEMEVAIILLKQKAEIMLGWMAHNLKNSYIEANMNTSMTVFQSVMLPGELINRRSVRNRSSKMTGFAPPGPVTSRRRRSHIPHNLDCMEPNMLSALLTVLLTVLMTRPDSKAAVIEFRRNGTVTVVVEARGLAMGQTVTELHVQTASACQCRRACGAWLRCHSVSYTKSTSDCRLQRKGFLNVTETDSDSVFYYVYLSEMPGEPLAKIIREKDGLYYFYLPERLKYEEAKQSCEKWPGFHLPIIITKDHYDVANASYQLFGFPYFLDLGIDKSGSYMWSNGMDYYATTHVNLNMSIREDYNRQNETAQYFVFYREEVYTTTVAYNLKVACQANLDQRLWD